MSEEKKKLEYLRGLISSGVSVIDDIARINSLRNDVQPPIEPETGRFLEFMVLTSGAERVLELGTSNGYSALWMAKALRKTGGCLTTIDSKERLHLEALENFKAAGFDDIITAVCGDASEELDKLEPGFDIIFQDCGKYLYPQLFDRTVELLKRGGIIIADDTLFSFEAEVRPNLGKYTDQYNSMVFGCDKLLTSIIPVGHGLSLSYKL